MTRLGDILRSLADKADGADNRLDALEADTGWTKIYYVETLIDIKARRVGGMVTVSARSWSGHLPLTTEWKKATTLPEMFRPNTPVFVGVGSSGSNNVSIANIEADGIVWVSTAGGTVNDWCFSITYPAG